MTLSDIYGFVKTKAESITGKTYTLDRAPQVNFSEGQTGAYRYFRPAGITKERTTRGTPQSVITVEVGIISMDHSETAISGMEEELDGLLNSILRTGQIADNILVYGSETRPTTEHIINSEGLDAEVPVIEATATIGIRAFY